MSKERIMNVLQKNLFPRQIKNCRTSDTDIDICKTSESMSVLEKIAEVKCLRRSTQDKKEYR